MEKTEEEKGKGEKEVFWIFRKTQTQTDMRAHRHTDRQTHTNIGIMRFFYFRSEAVIFELFSPFTFLNKDVLTMLK